MDAMRTATRIVALLMALLLLGCGAAGEHGGATDTIAIGITFDQPGLGQKVEGRYEGFDVEVARYVARELGYDEAHVVWKEAPAPQRENLLLGGQVRLVVASYSITPERRQVVGFAGPYLVTGQDLLVRTDSPIASVDDLAGHLLCTVGNTTSATAVKQRVPDVELREFDTYFKCVEALANGSVDAVTTDAVVLAGFAAQERYRGRLRLVGTPLTEERYGIGLPKGDRALCEKVSAALVRMVASGEWQRALQRTVGASGHRLPAAPTMAPCQ